MWDSAETPATLGYFLDGVTFPELKPALVARSLGSWDFETVTTALLTSPLFPTFSFLTLRFLSAKPPTCPKTARIQNLLLPSVATAHLRQSRSL